MAAKDKKITLKTLHSDIITLKEELNYNKKYLSELQKELKDAKEEIKELKFINNNKKDNPASKCSSTKSFELHMSAGHACPGGGGRGIARFSNTSSACNIFAQK